MYKFLGRLDRALHWFERTLQILCRLIFLDYGVSIIGFKVQGLGFRA